MTVRRSPGRAAWLFALVAILGCTPPVPREAEGSGVAKAPAERAARFEPLNATVGSSSVVALGEEHADGTTFQLKTELVRYLHEELGFDRVVLEAGLFSCAEMAKELAQGVPAGDVTGLCNFRWAECSKEAFTLVEYVAETHRTDRPLRVSGVDPQLSGSAPRDRLVAELEEATGERLASDAREAIVHLFDLHHKRSATEREIDRFALEELHSRVKERIGPDSIWNRIVDGFIFLDADHWDFQNRGIVTNAIASARDAQMAMNLLWLRRRFPKERMILLAANGHIARMGTKLACNNPAHDHGDESFVPMGEILAKSLTDDYVAVAVSAASGRAGLPGAEAEPVTRAVAGSVEFEALTSPNPWAYLDRTELLARGEMLSVHMAPMNEPILWSQRFDGMFVLKSTAPHTARGNQECRR